MSGTSGAGAGPTAADYRNCAVVWVVAVGIVGVALGGPLGLARVGGALAGVGGGIITAAALCPMGGAEMARRAREDLEQLLQNLNQFTTSNAAAVGSTACQTVNSSRTAVTDRLRRDFSLTLPQADRVFSQMLAWAQGNPDAAGRMCLALPRQASDNSCVMPTPVTADIVAAVTGLA